MRIDIDLRKSLPENAQTYYDASKKAKRKLPGLKKALEDTQKKINNLSLKDVKQKISAPKKKPKKKWYEKFRWFNSTDGFLVIGGRDATSNDILIKKYLQPNDLVYHADIQGAPFFIVKNPAGKELPGETKREAAQAAASYSSAWKRGQASADVYEVSPDQVSNTPPSGEYLPKGAFMIYGEKNWHRNMPLKVAIGVNQKTKIIGGPLSAVKIHSKKSVALVPGDDKSGALAKKIRQKLGGGELADIQYFIPTGQARILPQK
ncbi:MAG: DUF814 domain-containing protein [Candidatus Altiarchaeales archaeon]|nr:DUF814 domain-containing protein [Candidatus Altiarchaeales archaeon]